MASIDDIVAKLSELGYINYRCGCFAKMKPGRSVPDGFKRFKFSERVLRYERWYAPGKRWQRLRSAPYSKIIITDKGFAGLVY